MTGLSQAGEEGGAFIYLQFAPEGAEGGLRTREALSGWVVQPKGRKTHTCVVENMLRSPNIHVHTTSRPITIHKAKYVDYNCAYDNGQSTDSFRSVLLYVRAITCLNRNCQDKFREVPR